MAAARKVGWAQLRVGIMAVVALVILAVLIFLLTGSTSIFERHATLRTYMQDSAGMAEGSPVRLNGILIGKLDTVRLSGSRDPKRTVEIVMEVQERFLPEIPDDSVASVAASNLLGDKFINISKGPNRNGRHVQPNAELRSLEAQDIPELMAQSAQLLASLQTIVKRVDAMLGDIEAGRGNIGKFLRDEELYGRLNAIASTMEHLLGDVRTGKGTISRLLYDDSLYQEIRAPLQRLDSMLADLQRGQGTAGKLLKDEALYADSQKSIAEMRKLIEEINAGKGTAGKLLKDEKLYAGLNQLLVKIDGTIDRMNSGQGTVGQLLTNPQLYDSMNLATRELNLLVKDIRANPKKFLTIKLVLF